MDRFQASSPHLTPKESGDYFLEAPGSPQKSPTKPLRSLFQEEVISLGVTPGQQGTLRLYISLVSHPKPSLNTWARLRNKNEKAG